MEEESLHMRYLIVIAAVLCALIIGYNAFYVPDASMSNIRITTDISSTTDEEYTPQSDVATSHGPTLSKPVSGKININTATKQQLSDGLSGIGEVFAKRIVAYREKNGGFKSIEEIKSISGIGEKTFEKLKDNITI